MNRFFMHNLPILIIFLMAFCKQGSGNESFQLGTNSTREVEELKIHADKKGHLLSIANDLLGILASIISILSHLHKFIGEFSSLKIILY